MSRTTHSFYEVFDDFAARVQLDFEAHTALLGIDKDLPDEPVHKGAVKLVFVLYRIQYLQQCGKCQSGYSDRV